MMNVPELALISVKPPPALKGIEPQSDVLDFLGNPSSYGVDISRVERLDTHGAYIFLAGDNVFKVKRAVPYPYLDYSTLQKREWACRRAIMLNQRTAPTLYIGVVAVLRQADGRLAVGRDRNDDQSEVLE
jgi:aminoglycoside phosphotransferase family enzyme